MTVKPRLDGAPHFQRTFHGDPVLGIDHDALTVRQLAEPPPVDRRLAVGASTPRHLAACPSPPRNASAKIGSMSTRPAAAFGRRRPNSSAMLAPKQCPTTTTVS